MTSGVSYASRLLAEVTDAQRAECARLADALHDDALQMILTARQDLDQLRGVAGPAATEELHHLRETLLDVERSLRAVTGALHEDALETVALDVALQRIGAEAARRGRFTVRLEVQPAAVGIHDGAVRGWVRELLHNAAKHAGATAVGVLVACDEQDMTVSVHDDGRGFGRDAEAEARAVGSLGVARLRRLVAGLGGTVAVTDARPGTRVTITLPLAVLEAQRSLDVALGEERRWSSALVAALQDALAVFRDGRLVQVNDAFCAVTGFAREQLLRPPVEALPLWISARRDAQIAQLADAIGGGEGPVEVEIDLLRADGGTFPALLSMCRIDDGYGGSAGVVITLRDLTERRLAEQRARLSAELDSTIRTAQLLSGLQEAVGPEAIMGHLGAIVTEHLGWDGAVLNVRTDAGYRVAWTSGAAIDADLAGVSYPDAAFAPYLDDAFARHGCFWIPEELDVNPLFGPVHIAPERPAPADTGPATEPARPGDMLFVPLCREDRALFALLSVDGPPSGRRPSDTELEVLRTIADHAARALAPTLPA